MTLNQLKYLYLNELIKIHKTIKPSFLKFFMKILELTNYTSGTCGVFSRVLQESKLLSKKGHEVYIFSSNRIKGSKGKSNLYEQIDKIKIFRFPTIKLGGESFMHWDFIKEANIISPDLIIAHSYRHPHTIKALKIAESLKIPIFLVTHAPFQTGNEKHSKTAKLAIYLHDKFVGKKRLKQFTKILTITKWENSFLKKLEVPNEKIEYIPNGIPEEFFKIKYLHKEQNKILFLGRISEIKNLETLIKSIPLIKDEKIKIEIVGPAEKTYLKKLKILINSLKLNNRIIFSPAIYDLKEKIKKIDSSKIFVLPSLREGMPQSLIEAMARKKMVIASKNPATEELIENNKSGFLFQIKNSEELAKSINYSLSLNKKQTNKIQLEAHNSVKKFSWKIILNKLEKVINQHSSKNRQVP
ncbi:hypothetical protein COU54_01030 [Candidatus Pacearchaeota archaeon CG10_big_fil_rev_8_21_14_0_10_31_24]|nr:MAG: hypothetical protein COU54_01030 [Candidatus Pacearchaeota archaeon CG10_big_fil_rev_8_21_14_0_10_31_24]